MTDNKNDHCMITRLFRLSVNRLALIDIYVLQLSPSKYVGLL